MSRVLVIDDEPGVRSAVRFALGTIGAEVFEADNAEAGLRMARSHRPDVVICDLNLGGKSGLDLLAEMRQDPATATVPVILITGGDAAVVMRRSMDLGADDFLQKPFNARELIAAVNARIHQRDLVRAEAERTNERLRRLLEATGDMVAIVEADALAIQYMNRAVREVTGLQEPGPTTPVFVRSLMTRSAYDGFQRAALPAAILDGVWRGESSWVRSNGDDLRVRQEIIVHRKPGGAVDCLSLIAHDISTELQLRQAQKLQAIGHLAAGIAHEINTPVQFIGDNTRFVKETFGVVDQFLGKCAELIQTSGVTTPAAAGLLAECRALRESADLDYLRKEVPIALDQTLEGVERISNILRAMKDFSHPGMSEKSLVDVNKLIESTLTICRNEWKYVAELVTDFDLSLTAVPCLPGEFNQVMLNLIVNAAHAMSDNSKQAHKSKGTLRITTKRNGPWAEVRIADTGAGIPESARPHIFEPFFTTKEVGRGTGQGLAMAHSVIVGKHSGTIQFETEVGKGTTFTVKLPLNATEVPSKT